MATQRLIPMREPARNLACGFWRSADRLADRPALDFGQCVVSYAQLRELACSLAATLDKHQPPEGPRLVALAETLPANFAQVLGFNDARIETRKQAVFWMAQMRGREGADITSSIMFTDKDAEVREHAAFSLAQSESPRVTADLIRLGNTDRDAEVRAQAWFWLAHTAAPETESAIFTALSKETDAEVRERAILALSRLPDERAAKALLTIAEDRSQSRELRKRAVFWLSQSDSDTALTYLEQVLTAN